MDALKRSPLLSLRYPMEQGVVVNWDEIEMLIGHIYKECAVVPNEVGVLFAETALNPQKTRRQLCELFYEKLDVPSLYLALQGYLSLMAEARETGICF